MIFYTYNTTPLASGILDMEDLSSQNKRGETHQRKYSAGPYSYKGSESFVIIYKSLDKDEKF